MTITDKQGNSFEAVQVSQLIHTTGEEYASLPDFIKYLTENKLLYYSVEVKTKTGRKSCDMTDWIVWEDYHPRVMTDDEVRENYEIGA